MSLRSIESEFAVPFPGKARDLPGEVLGIIEHQRAGSTTIVGKADILRARAGQGVVALVADYYGVEGVAGGIEAAVDRSPVGEHRSPRRRSSPGGNWSPAIAMQG